MMRRLFIFTMMALMAVMVTKAQTADNSAATISWKLNSGTATEQPVYSPDDTNKFFEKTEMVIGTGLNSPVAMTSELESITQSMFSVKKKTSSASDDNAVRFLVTLKDGIAFTPTSISFKAFRWKTDKGNFDAVWICDDARKTLATGVRPNRGAGSGAGTVSSYSYDLSGSSAAEKQFGLSVNIYNFDVAADKGLSLGDLVIEGTLYGTVGQPLSYTLTVAVSPEGAGSVSVNPAGPNYQSGQEITVTQQPTDGYVFTGWRTDTGKTLSSSDSYSFSIKGNMSLTASYVTRQSLTVNDYIVVGDISEFRAAIRQINEENSGRRRFVFMKNGVYDYGEYNNPESGADPYGRDTIKADNVSLIGQSIEGVIVQIQPKQASVSRTAPIVITGMGTYLQDFTLQNNYSYSGNDGQAAALMDKGHHTIGKNMRFVSRQDTYYSNTDNGQLYFETSEFQGTVDYICGRGDVFFNRCTLNNVNRYPNSGNYKGDTHIAAPYTVAENFDDAGGHGYIFMDCHVDCKSQTWDFGRGWRGWPKLAFLNTVLSPDAVLRIGTDQASGKPADPTKRVTTKGIQTSSDSHYMQFYEYNTMDEQGNVVSPASNVLTFTASDSKSYETILKADETARFQLRSVYPDWQPDEDCRQIEVTACRLEGSTLTWEAGENAKAFLIEKDGQFVAIVDGTQNSYQFAAVPESVTVRAANMMGGFGPAVQADKITGITETVQSSKLKVQSVYDLQGRKLSESKSARGLQIMVTTREDGTRRTFKIIR